MFIDVNNGQVILVESFKSTSLQATQRRHLCQLTIPDAYFAAEMTQKDRMAKRTLKIATHRSGSFSAWLLSRF